MTGRIFINYRREDDQAAAGRLYDRLLQHFDREQLFMDIEAIEPSVDFVKTLDQQVAECIAFIAVIGPRWLNARNNDGNPKLDNPTDCVRVEIESALKRDIRVIPVLVDGASMPRPSDLPPSLHALARRNAVEIAHHRFAADCDDLARHIKRALGVATTPSTPAQLFIAPPRVFISYSHDSDQHMERVLALADRLRTEGIDATIDRYLEAPALGWPAWCAGEIRKADFVLMVCTEIYRRRVDQEDEPGRGHGVLWEARLINQELYDAGSVSAKFVPVLLEAGSPEHVPAPVRGMTTYEVETDDGFESLCRLLLKQPATPPPPIGARKVRLPPRARAAGRPVIEAQPNEGTVAEPAAAARSTLGSILAADYAVAPRVELNPGANDSAEPFSLIWNVPYTRNLQFTGRSDVIVRLETELNSGPAAAVTQAIAGLGGIGKTQLALEFCYRNREKYKVIWWIRAESKETRITDLVALGPRIGLIDIDSSDDSASIRPIIEWLDRNSKWLLIFDNVEDPLDLDGLLPTAGRGHILITSRRAAWGSRANAVALDVWTVDEASRYLLKRTGQADTEVNRASATALADALGYLPLAIEQAAAYIDESRIGIVGYAELFEKQQLRLLRRRPSHRNSDEKTIATVWEISLRSVEQRSPGAVAFLTLCAFMRPDQISKDDIKNHSQVMPEPLRTTASNTMALHDAIAVLRAYSLIEATDQFVSIHRLVQLVVRDRLNASDYRQFHELADRLEYGVADSQYPDEQPARTLLDTSIGIWADLFGKTRTRRNFLIFAGTTVTVGGIALALYKRPEGPIGSGKDGTLPPHVFEDIQKVLQHRGHALLIGQSHYTRGWDELASVRDDLQNLKAGLAPHFETVETVQDPTVSQLRDGMREFLLGKWNMPGERLLIYYAGHGFTDLNQVSRENNGYITGSDTPRYNLNPGKAIENAVPFTEIDSWNRQTGALHVLMVFDSCFSGTLFQTMGSEEKLRRKDLDGIRRMLSQPIRYYITSGRKEEVVTADSTFATLLLRGLRGEADFFHQGLVSADQLGIYLSREVPKHSQRSQTPQFSNIGNAKLSEGQFFFLTGIAATR